LLVQLNPCLLILYEIPAKVFIPLHLGVDLSRYI